MKQLIAALPLLFMASLSLAQNPNADFIKSIKGFNRNKCSYRYLLKLNDDKAHNVLDSVYGRMYFTATGYLDSNMHRINVKDQGLAVQLNQDERIAYIRKIPGAKVLKESSPESGDHVLININHFLEHNMAGSDFRQGSNGETICTVQFRDAALQEVTAVLDGEKYLKSLTVKIVAQYGDHAALSRVLIMDQFSDQFEVSVIDTGRFIAAGGKKPALKGAYAGYKVQPVNVTYQ